MEVAHERGVGGPAGVETGAGVITISALQFLVFDFQLTVLVDPAPENLAASRGGLHSALSVSAALLPATIGSNGLPLVRDGGGNGDVFRIHKADEAIPRGLVGRHVVALTRDGLEASKRTEERTFGCNAL